MYERKRRRWIVPVAVIVILFAAVSGAGYYLLETYTIETVYVEGNLHYTQEEIQDIVMEGPLGNNSLYLSLKYKNKGVENIPFVDVMDVSILSPDTIKISVYEKALAGYVKYMDTYMYFDKDGAVVENSSVKTVGVPQITGLTFEHVVVGEPLPVKNPEVFGNILNLTKLLNKYQLTADKIFFHSTKQITIYFGGVKVSMGDIGDSLEDKIMLLPKFLQELEGKSGTLYLENFSEDNSNVTFKPDKE